MWVGDCVHTVIPPWGVFVNAVGFQGFQFVARPRSGVYVCVCVRACALWCLNYAGEIPAWCIIGRLTENDQVKCIWKLDLQLGHYTKWIFFFSNSFQQALSGLLSEFLLHYWKTFKRCPESQKSVSTISVIWKLSFF